MFDLATFSLVSMTECGAALRRVSNGAASLEEASERVVRYLRENLVDADKKPALALVRLYKTHEYGSLPADLQAFARSVFGDAERLSPTTKCLTLLATSGDHPDWRSRRTSKGHQAIPLISEEVVARLPMVSQLVSQFGLEVSSLLRPDPSFLVDAEQKTYNVFFVEEAAGSPYIPAQDEFVAPSGIRSVLGFGGLLPSGDLFAVIAFSKVPIGARTADLFKTLALNVKMALLPVVASPLFGEG